MADRINLTELRARNDDGGDDCQAAARSWQVVALCEAVESDIAVPIAHIALTAAWDAVYRTKSGSAKRRKARAVAEACEAAYPAAHDRLIAALAPFAAEPQEQSK